LAPFPGKSGKLRRPGLCALALGGAAFCLILPGCAGVAESRAERAVNDLLPTYLGPADSYRSRVRVDSLGAAMRGRLESVHIDGEGVHFAGGLTMDHLTLDLEAIEVDTKRRSLKNIGAARFTARLGTVNLNRFLTGRRPDIQGLSAELEEGFAHMEARPAMLRPLGISGFNVPVGVEGRLAPVSGNDSQLDFVPDAARISILPIPKPVVDFIAHSVNPVVDLSGLPIPIHIRSVDIRPDGIYLTGGASPDDILRAAGSAGATGQ